MNLEITLNELKRLINCMNIVEGEFGPLSDKSFYKLLKKLKKLEENEKNRVIKKQ